MEKKSQDFSVRQAQQLAKTPAGQQLYQLLQKEDTGQIQQAMDAAAKGDYSQAGKALQSLLASPEAQKLIRQLGGRHG